MWDASLTNMIQEALINLHLPRMEVIDVIEVIVLIFLFYNIVKAIRGTRAWILLKGILILIALYILAYVTGLKVIVIIFQSILIFLALALVIIIQPELRRLVEKIGANNISGSIKDLMLYWKNKRKEPNVKLIYSNNTVTELVKAVYKLSNEKTGALIVIERNIPLNEYIETGIKINADITSELIINIFEVNTPLHDGAVIIRDSKIASGTSYLPLSDSKKIGKDLGTRHRAAMGLTEITDAMVIVVSEETGAVSLSINGKLHRRLNRDELTNKLKEYQAKELIELKRDKLKQRKLSDILLNNIWIKLSTAFIVFMVWGIIINSVNPVINKQFTGVPINVVNEDVIGDMNLTYSIEGNSLTDVVVTDRKDIVDNIRSSDISITADLRELSITNSVLLKAELARYPTALVKLSKPSINVHIEEIVTTEIDIETKLIGKNNDNYYISEIELNESTLTISGAKSVINKIGSAVIELNQETLNRNMSINCYIKILDKNGEEIDKELLNMSIDKVEARVTLYETKEIPINILITYGNDNLRDLVKSVEYSADSIYVAGNQMDLDLIQSLNIEVPIDISIGEVSKSKFIKSIDVNEYIGDLNIQVPSKYSKMQIELNFNNFDSLNKTVKTSDIAIRNKSDRLDYTILTDDVNITLVSNQDIEDDENIVLYIDVSKIREGEHTVQVNLEGREGIILYDTVLTDVQVVNK